MYYVIARGDSTYTSQCYDGCTPVTVAAASGVSGIDLALPLAAHIHGTALGPDGSPLSGIYAYAFDVNSPNQYRAEIGSDGTYSLTVPDGSYTIGFIDWNLNYISGCYSTTSAPSLVTLPAEIMLDPACTRVNVMASGPTSPGEATVPEVRMALAGVTPVGTNVEVTPAGVSDVTITFSGVATGGITTATVSQELGGGQPTPSGFQLSSSPTYYDLSTGAKTTGPIEVCLPYEPWAYADPSLVRLLHWNGSRWDDVTTSLDQVNDVVCGTTTSLSPFVVAQSLQQLQSITFSPLADQTYGAGPIALSATASSGLAMTYSSTGPCAVNADTLSISGAGTCTVTASQAGNDAWQAAAPLANHCP